MPPFRKGNPGRPRGATNRATRDIQQFSRRTLEDPAYVKALKERLRDGRAPHMETLLAHYAYGKPKETMLVEADLPPFVVRVEQDDPAE